MHAFRWHVLAHMHINNLAPCIVCIPFYVLSKGTLPLIRTDLLGYISERQSRLKELQELEKKLTASHRDLREEELKMKHQVTYIHAYTHTPFSFTRSDLISCF